MLEPKRRKYRKSFRGKMRGNSLRGSSLSFGEFGLKAQGRGWLASKQIEAGRRAITHSLKKGGRVWIRIFPDKPITDKPPEVRMGGGKGDVVEYVFTVKPGRILYEIGGIPEDLAIKAMKTVASKMPIKTKFAKKN